MRELIDKIVGGRENPARAGAKRASVWWHRLMLAALVVAYAVLWVGGVGHYLFVGAVAVEQNWLASAFLTVAGMIVLLTATSRGERLRLVVVAGFGLLVELCGVRTGLPFGRYTYTDVLQPTIFGVPLVMAFAWMTLVAYVKQMLSRLNLTAWGGALVAAAWMTAIDLVIDPLAANQLGYWRWGGRGSYYGIPLSNFIGWFTASLAIFMLFRKPWRSHLWASLTGLSIILFFTLIALSFQLYAAALVGFGLCAVHFLVIYKRHNSSTKSLADRT